VLCIDHLWLNVGVEKAGPAAHIYRLIWDFKKEITRFYISEYAFPPLERMQIFSVDPITVLQMRPLKKTFCPALIPHRSSGDGEDSL